MSTIFSLCGLTGFLLIIACITEYDWRKLRVSPIVWLALITAITRFAFINFNSGYSNDIHTFQAWADTLFTDGLSKFYLSETFKDYPPGYMYILYICGAIKNIFALSDNAWSIVIKLPAILFDVATTGVIYHIAARRTNKLHAFLIGLAYALNPMVILDSAIWGQVDSVHTLALLASVYLLSEKKLMASCTLFGVAMLIKPQSLILAPIFLYDFYDRINGAASNPAQSPTFLLRTTALILLRWVVVAALMALLCLPFTKNFDFMPLVKTYLSTLASYPYASVNAYNFYAFIGANWVDVTEPAGGLSYQTLGFIFIALITLFSFIILHIGRMRKSSKFFVAGLLFVLVFLLSARMHERYLFPALAFLLVAFAYRRDKRIMLFYGGYTLTMLANCADVLYLIQNGNDLELIETSMRMISLINIIFTLCMCVYGALMYIKRGRRSYFAPVPIDRRNSEDVVDQSRLSAIEASAPALRFHKWDAMLVAALMLVYAPITFFQLGDTTAPQTAWVANANDSVTFRITSNAQISNAQTSNAPITRFAYLLGARNDKPFKVEVSDTGGNWREIVSVEENSVFKWAFIDIEDEFEEQLIRLTSVKDELYIMELALLDKDNRPVPLEITQQNDLPYYFAQAANDSLPPATSSDISTQEQSTDTGGDDSDSLNESPLNDSSFYDPLISSDPAFLIDEQDLVPANTNNMNSTYFDEIYHGRTAYEFIHHLGVYEWTHPPLGKSIISLGIAMFGMTPFGWRFAGALFGVLMIPLMYLLTKKIFAESRWAFFGTFIFTFDFMHFAQTRLATIDVFVTFFIMAMYLFMLMYCSSNFYDKSACRHGSFIRSLVYLLCCGICAGLACAVKWEGVYALLGLPVLFFYTLYKRRREYLHTPNVDNNNISHFPAYATITLGACLIFFVAVPALIYCASYFQYLQTPNHSGIAAIIKNQGDMFRYHANLESEHPYSSYWFQWPFMMRPIYYYSGTIDDTIKTGISSFGNPAVWYAGIVALLYCIRRQSKSFSFTILFLFVAYASNYLPWTLISRTTYIYHYFPSVPFVCLLVAFMFRDWVDVRNKRFTAAYMILTFILFVVFYPTLSGMPVYMWFVNSFLKWMPTWVLT
ncbi:MAG: phospholipid carrier-dependent glycosyltransferase [Clostridiales bacterium]|jgi:Gpi18-like mannosyltransferase|nr:phospholipid carrier-dependent glycosyltransferase [Clostridiales bacterium]